MYDLFWKQYDFKRKGANVTSKEMGVLAVLLFSLVLGGFFCVGVPIIVWHLLAPAFFWQKLATLIGVLIYESFAVPVGIMITTSLVAAFV